MRHTGRVIAVQVLYGLDAQGDISGVDRAIAAHHASFGRRGAEDEVDEAQSLDAGGESRSFARELCHGVAENLEQLDKTLERASTNWRVARMSRVDRNVLRLAAFELLYRPETPAPVVLDEAIELGKQLGSIESGAFINGVLGKVITGLKGRGD
jgi:transcription antitermination protein NusB